MKLAICNDVYKDWAWEDVCRDAAEAGYDGIEVAPFTFGKPLDSITDEERETIKSVAVDLGVPVVGLHWLLVGPEGLHLYDPEARDVTRPYLELVSRFCADIGGEVLVFGSPAQRCTPENMDRQVAQRLAKEVLTDWAELCGELGLLLCLEPLTPDVTDFLTSAAETDRLIKEIDHPALALHLDVRATLSEKQPTAELIRVHKDTLRHLHVNDAGMIPPGAGSTEYGPIIAALRDIDYSGYLSLEVFDLQGKDPQTVARESAEYLRSFL